MEIITPQNYPYENCNCNPKIKTPRAIAAPFQNKPLASVGNSSVYESATFHPNNDKHYLNHSFQALEDINDLSQDNVCSCIFLVHI